MHRIYADYFMPSRLKEYERLITTALENGYEHLTLPEFFNKVAAGKVDGKYFIHRHDIDTDVRTAGKMFGIEKKLSVKTSYYFRLNTWTPALINEIHSFGSEAGYHYEELAQFCKDKKITTADEVKKHYGEIRTIFRRNFNGLNSTLNFKMNTIASHGDFVNRKLGIANHDFVTRELMDELGILFECYDDRLMKNFTTILSDTHYPVYYRPTDPFDAIRSGSKVIYLLTHPRHWHTAVIENTSDNFKRMLEGLRYRKS